MAQKHFDFGRFDREGNQRSTAQHSELHGAQDARMPIDLSRFALNALPVENQGIRPTALARDE